MDSHYTLSHYGAMIGDAARMNGYARALEQAVRRDSVVIDIGTGTGIFALIACRLGARRVYAIEPADVIQIAREIAAASGCGDRIEFIQAMSTDVTLPERAHVVISDLSGALPWFHRHIESIADARRRFLAPDGVLIPLRDTVWAAAVEQPDVYARHMGPWDNAPFGLDMQAARRIVANTCLQASVMPDNVLTDVPRWAALDYAVADDPDVRGRVTLTTMRGGTAHGIALGFDRILADGICFSNAPDAANAIRATVYPTMFFPWPEPVALDAGDLITVEIEARLVRRDYIWNWKTQAWTGEVARRQKADFSQSTFFGVPLSPATLRRKRREDTATAPSNPTAA